jgi:hypothetical protein
MVTVPGFLLRTLYVKKSLTNTDDGFQFQIRNRLGSGYAYKVWPLTVDGDEVPEDDAVFDLEGVTTSFSQVTKERTFSLAMNRTITISVAGVKLAPGPRKIGMGFDVPGLGTLRFDFTDVVADE